MKAKLRPNRHGKWSHKKIDSITKKMILVRELFNLVGTELDHGKLIPNVIFCKFYGNERRFTLDEEYNKIYINEKFIKSKDLDYIITCAICYFYIERQPQLILGGKVTLVDIHTCIDISDNVAKEVLKTVAKNVAAVALTQILIRILI